MGWWRQLLSNTRFEREGLPEERALPARRRRMLLFSMILVIPLGVAAVGTGINVGLATATRVSFAAGDYDGAAAWARAGVSLNPFDQYLPHYNLGTAYAAGDLLPEAVPELRTALDASPSPEAACYPRANLALTYVRLGNRYVEERAWDAAIDAYREAKALWAKQQNDVCHQDQSFSDTAEESSDEAEEGENQAQQQQEEERRLRRRTRIRRRPRIVAVARRTPTPTPSGTPTPGPDPNSDRHPEPRIPPATRPRVRRVRRRRARVRRRVRATRRNPTKETPRPSARSWTSSSSSARRPTASARTAAPSTVWPTSPGDPGPVSAQCQLA